MLQIRLTVSWMSWTCRKASGSAAACAVDASRSVITKHSCRLLRIWSMRFCSGSPPEDTSPYIRAFSSFICRRCSRRDARRALYLHSNTQLLPHRKLLNASSDGFMTVYYYRQLHAGV